MRVFILTLIILLAHYQDFFAFKYFGEIAKSPMIFLTPFFLLHEVLSLKKNKTRISKYQSYLILYIFLLFFLSIVYLGIIYINRGTIVFFNENIIVKSIKFLVYPLTYLLFYRFIYNFLRNDEKNLNRLFKAIYINQILIIIILVLELPALKKGTSLISFFHPVDYKYWRIRLLTLETSWSGSVILIFSLTPIFLANYLKIKITTIIKITSIALLLLYVAFNTSKGFILSLFIVITFVAIDYMIKKGIKPTYIVLGFIVLIIPLGNLTTIVTYISENLSTGQSFGTRFTSYLTSIKTFIYNPLGVGFSGFLPIYTDNLAIVIEDLSKYNQFNLLEVKEYLSSARVLSTKTYFFDQLIFGGIGFLLFFYLFFIKRIQWIRKRILQELSFTINYVTLLFIIMISFTYITFHIKYEIWLFLALLDYIEYHFNEKEKI